MNYDFESLAPDRFQLLCQSLLVKEYFGFQCFPIGQPDGGRDGLVRYIDTSNSKVLLYQVKFVRDCNKISNPHKKLVDSLTDELNELEHSLFEDVERYVLVTNVRGTGKSESGSIDRVQSLLDDKLPVPGICLWRNDLERRLDGCSDIKWAFPEVMRGTDVLHWLLESDLSEERRRRTTAVQLFISHQYDREKEVRFKQVELQNRIEDLFVDVPIDTNSFRLREDVSRERHRETITYLDILSYSGKKQPGREEEGLGAAQLLLAPETKHLLPRIVLEGAPGQGKSTVVQFVSQMYRMKILGRSPEIENQKNCFDNIQAKLPLKIDCRDLSLWLNSRNPFGGEDLEFEGVLRSLETFLAALIQQSSGGIDFSVADLHEVVKVSEILFVADGLDEVAGIDARKKIITALQQGISRLETSAQTFQCVITSRPAAFTNTPGLSTRDFCYVALDALSPALITDYAKNWIRARRLSEPEGREIRNVLKDKLNQPHLRDLSRNAMQLAILLSLLHTRGVSLPDKRTSLYDSYIELFFNREAEKSTIVRDHRDILVQIHRYLAWLLHNESQTKQESGSIDAKRLQQVVRQFLEEEGYDTALVDSLFSGIVERVVALVSRVEGTYEFEVQPLREYFAARHLYDTAPYSPPGRETTGTLPDRFDALARDSHWLNVTRFFAGCYSKGQLSSLVESLEDLSKAEAFKYTGIPNSLALMLLADSVFNQNPKSSRKVVDLLLKSIGLHHFVLTLGGRFTRTRTKLVLPKGSGKEELVEQCFDTLFSETVPRDYALRLVEVIRDNTTSAEVVEQWSSLASRMEGRALTRWLRFGVWLGVTSLIDSAELLKICRADPNERNERLLILARAGDERLCSLSEPEFSDTLMAYLESPRGPARHTSSFSNLTGRIALVTNPHFYLEPLEFCGSAPLNAVLDQRRMSILKDLPEKSQVERYSEIRDFLFVVNDAIKMSGNDWRGSLTPWNMIVEAGRAQFGDTWAFTQLANTAAGIRSRTEKAEGSSNLFDSEAPLCFRMRHARLRSSSVSWWRRVFNSSNSPNENRLALFAFLSWAGQSVLRKSIDQVGEELDKLPEADWRRVIQGLKIRMRGGGEGQTFLHIDDSSFLASSTSERLFTALRPRLSNEAALSVYKEMKDATVFDDPYVAACHVELALIYASTDARNWPSSLKVVKQAYGSCEYLPMPHFSRALFSFPHQQFPVKYAKDIVRECDKYPADLVALAEQSCRDELMSNVTPVGEIAERDSWFKLK